MENNTHNEWDWIKDIPEAKWGDDWSIDDLIGKKFKYKNKRLYNDDFTFTITSTLGDDLFINVTLYESSHIYHILRSFDMMKHLINQGDCYFI